MIRSFKLLIAAAAAMGIAAAANAQSVDQRHANQQHRIEQGVASGRLTPREARRDERQQRSIRHEEYAMRARHGGHLTWRDRQILRHRENRASHRIHRTKHNWRHD